MPAVHFPSRCDQFPLKRGLILKVRILDRGESFIIVCLPDSTPICSEFWWFSLDHNCCVISSRLLAWLFQTRYINVYGLSASFPVCIAILSARIRAESRIKGRCDSRIRGNDSLHFPSTEDTRDFEGTDSLGIRKDLLLSRHRHPAYDSLDHRIQVLLIEVRLSVSESFWMRGTTHGGQSEEFAQILMRSDDIWVLSNEGVATAPVNRSRHTWTWRGSSQPRQDAPLRFVNWTIEEDSQYLEAWIVPNGLIVPDCDPWWERSIEKAPDLGWGSNL
jgi:hypothetical protein